MVEGYYFQDMRINEKGAFAKEVLAVAVPYGEKDPELKPLIDDASSKSQILSKALDRLSVADITKLMNEDDDQRDNGIANLESYALSCSKRKDPVWANAGQVVVNALKTVGWDMNYRSNKEETNLIDTFLLMVDSQENLKKALVTINAQEWIDEIRGGQTSYVQHTALRKEAEKPGSSITSREAARDLGTAIDKLFRYINFQIEFKASATYATLADEINKTIAEYRAAIKQRATRAENEEKKKA